MVTTPGARVRFVDGQLLSAADLNDEQQDQIARHRRHAIGSHTWGIVNGGELSTTDDGVVTVAPVFAYDGYGRELELADQALPAAERFELLNTDVLDVWLVYRRDAVPAPLEEPSCHDEDQAGRWQEVPLVRFTASAGAGAARRPPGVSPADIPFPPSRTPPDDPTREWPVFLGQIHRSPGQTAGAYTYRADGSGRVYVGARASSIEAPWGLPPGATLELDPAAGTALDLSTPNAPANPILTVSDAGDVDIEGSARIAGELRVGGGRVTLDANPDPGGPEWRIYHVGGPAAAEDELRIEIGSSPGRVVIGSWSATKSAFVSHLTIEDSGQVVVSGDLRVVGSLDVDGQTALKVYLDALKQLHPDVPGRAAA